jgi:hypothetical protein
MVAQAPRHARRAALQVIRMHYAPESNADESSSAMVRHRGHDAEAAIRSPRHCSVMTGVRLQRMGNAHDCCRDLRWLPRRANQGRRFQFGVFECCRWAINLGLGVVRHILARHALGAFTVKAPRSFHGQVLVQGPSRGAESDSVERGVEAAQPLLSATGGCREEGPR